MTRAPLRSLIGFEKEADIVVAGAGLAAYQGEWKATLVMIQFPEKKCYIALKKKSKMNFEMGQCQSRNMSQISMSG